MTWYWIVGIVLISLGALLFLSDIFYKQFFKRFYDLVFSGLAILIFSPLLLILTVIGAIAMRGNPFFTQPRPGKIDPKTGKEKIFKLIKFRTMSNRKDKDGHLLPDEQRLTGYGKFVRRTSLDELPELFSIFLGDMSLIGPRPLLVEYLPWYTENERHRHDVRPGLTGWAQVNGRNYLSWEEKFAFDLVYLQKLSFGFDIQILFNTVKKVLAQEDVEAADNYELDENGVKWCYYGGRKYQIHEPLNIEREKANKR